MGEMVRLSGHSMEELKQKPLELAAAYAKEHAGDSGLKGCQNCGDRRWNGMVLNTTGNNGMATGGSGRCADRHHHRSCWLREWPPLRRQFSGVYLHGLAGDRAAENTGVTRDAFHRSLERTPRGTERRITMNETEAMRIYAAIDMDACRKNIDAMLAKLRPETKMTLVIKTDGYGHGALPVARLGETLDRVWGYAVATVPGSLFIFGETGSKSPF